MVIGATSLKLYRVSVPLGHFFLRSSLVRTICSSQTLEQTIRAAVESKRYQEIPDILRSSKEDCKNPNPFGFLSSFPQCLRTQVVSEILESLMPLRPRFRPCTAYDRLLSYTLQNASPFPLALAILQRILRSGCLPVPQTRFLMSSAWLDRRRQPQSVANILLEMKSIGYCPDLGTCNYVISTLCDADKWPEAVRVLKGMSGAGCIPNLESYGTVIAAMCKIRRTADAVEMMKEMMVKVGLMPRQGTVVKVLAALRTNREIWKAVEVIEFLEKEGCTVGFESFELVVEGSLECREYILAAKVVMGMTDKGFIPYIKVRQKVVQGLASAGEYNLACTVRQRFAELGS